MTSTWTVPSSVARDPAVAAARSYWLGDALADEPGDNSEHVLTSTARADVCVVGGGFTGLWTAIELKQRDPGLQVVVMEAGLCGSGASGTNAGILMNLWPKLPAMLRAGGEVEGLHVARASVDAIDHIRRFCVAHAIDAQMESNGWLWVANNSSQDGTWDATLDAATSHRDSPFAEVDSETATRLAGAPARSGLLDSTCIGLHPGRLVRGLLRTARRLGVTVYEHSPMTNLVSEFSGATVRTRTGAVRADAVVLAINAWCSQFPQLRRHLVTTASDNAVLRPRRELAAPPLANVSDAGRLLDYWRSIGDGKFLFGKAGVGLGWGARAASTMFAPTPRPDRLLKQIARTVPALADAEIVSSWRAPVEYSVTSLPFFGELTGFPGVYFGTGYSGDGIGPSVLGARVLASLATRGEEDLAATFLTRIPTGRGLPPEPLRFIGGQLVKHAMLRTDRKQDEERRIDPASSLLARMDPTSFVG